MAEVKNATKYAFESGFISYEHPCSECSDYPTCFKVIEQKFNKIHLTNEAVVSDTAINEASTRFYCQFHIFNFVKAAEKELEHNIEENKKSLK